MILCMSVRAQPDLRKSSSIQPMNVCIVDGDAGNGALGKAIEQFGFVPFGTSNPLEALEQIGVGRCRVVLCDLQTSGVRGLTFLDEALQRDPGAYVILITTSQSLDSAIDAIRRGAYDYLPKPIDTARLKTTLDHLAEQFESRRRVQTLELQLLIELEFHGIVGRSPAMLDLFDSVRRISPHYTSLLLSSPPGTEKELVARAIHELSPVSAQRFAAWNCSANAETPVESQLFGHVRGAFMGAIDSRPGLLESSNGGTVFLDELAETSRATQTKLLRVIQSREIQRMGSPEVHRVEVRLIAATSRDLRADVVAGLFHEDLLDTLGAMQLRVPSLAERLEDIPLLAAFFVKKYNESYHKNIRGLTNRAKTLVMQYPWPGNVCEIENAISGAVMLASSDFIDSDDLPEYLRQPSSPASAVEPWQPISLEEVSNKHIQRVLEACGGNRVRAAHVLGIGRTSLYRYLKRESQNIVRVS